MKKELNQFNGERIIHTIHDIMRCAHSYCGTWIGNHLNKLFDSFSGHEIYSSQHPQLEAGKRQSDTGLFHIGSIMLGTVFVENALKLHGHTF